MFDENVLEAMLARLRSKSDAVAQRGKRPCACLIKTV